MKCYNCGNLGHKSIDCPNKKANSNNSNTSGIICHKCKQKGHMLKDCPLAQNTNNNNINNSINNNNNENQIKCYNCGQLGHKSIECPNQKGKFCYNCKKSGHIKANCPEKNKGGKKEENIEKTGDENNDDENNVLNCPICFMNTTSGKKFQVAKCGHIICKDCCNSLFKSSNITHCPICKMELKKENFMDIFI